MAQHVSSGISLIIRSSKVYLQPLVYMPIAIAKAEWALSAHSALATAGHHMGIYTRGCKYSLELLMMRGVPLEIC
jgi:threonine/homoserine efflux transporter RhtA